MTPRHILSKSRTWLLALALLALSACGQKGALYLPDERRAAPAESGHPA